MALRHIPVGSHRAQHRAEARPRRPAGAQRRHLGAVRLARRHATRSLRLKSGETRKVHVDCRATIGEVGNDEHNLRSYGKAGAKRWRGIRPTVRGVAMNPVDHPHGGGEGKSGQGNPHPVSPWGWQTKGKKTRRNKRTDSMIVQRRQNRCVKSEAHATFTEERSVRRSAPRQEGAGRRRQERPPADQDLVAPLDGHAGDGRPDDRRAQRQAAHAGADHREHGRPQARRVRPDAHLQGARRRPQSDARRSKPCRSSAKLRYARISPQKCRLVADMVRGQPVGQRARDARSSCRRRARSWCCKVLESAIANAEHNHGADIDELKVARIEVDAAPVLKRFARARQGARQPHRQAQQSHHRRRSATAGRTKRWVRRSIRSAYASASPATGCPSGMPSKKQFPLLRAHRFPRARVPEEASWPKPRSAAS